MDFKIFEASGRIYINDHFVSLNAAEKLLVELEMAIMAAKGFFDENLMKFNEIGQERFMQRAAEVSDSNNDRDGVFNDEHK